MVSELGQHTLGLAGVDPLESLADAAVELCAAHTGKPVVERPAHEVVRETVRESGPGSSSIVPLASASSSEPTSRFLPSISSSTGSSNCVPTTEASSSISVVGGARRDSR